MEQYTWQLYNAQGMPVQARGAPKLQAVIEGMLHGSAHVWIWRKRAGTLEVFVQKRAADKINWPHRYDKSAGGHILYGEQPIEAVVRKAKAELGLTIRAKDLQFIGAHHWMAPIAEPGLVENDFQWIYILEQAAPRLSLPTEEVETAGWKSLDTMQSEIAHEHAAYVPYGRVYFAMLAEAITLAVR